MLSAIPFIGVDLVEFEHFKNKILPVIGFVNSKALKKIKITPHSGATSHGEEKSEDQRHDSLGIRSSQRNFKWELRRFFPPPMAMGGKKIPYSFLAMFVGLIDGDGYISVNKTSKGYIVIELNLALHLRDLDLIKYIHSVLKIGRI